MRRKTPFATCKSSWRNRCPMSGRERMCRDMDEWGYTFRLGSAARWFEQDAEDAHDWLIAPRLARCAPPANLCLSVVPSCRAAASWIAVFLDWLVTRFGFFAANMPAVFGPYRRHADIVYGTDPQHRLDVYVPLGPPSGAASRDRVLAWRALEIRRQGGLPVRRRGPGAGRVCRDTAELSALSAGQDAGIHERRRAGCVVGVDARRRFRRRSAIVCI